MNDNARLSSTESPDENLVGAIDWTKIEAEYHAGKPLRAISEQFGVGKDAIARKAKRESWQKGATNLATGPRQDRENNLVSRDNNEIKELGPRQERDKAATNDVVSPVVSCASVDDREFDWEAEDIIVLHEQPRTAIYWNPNGALVIRQQNWPDEDVFVLIAREYLASFIDRLTDFLGIPSAP